MIRLREEANVTEVHNDRLEKEENTTKDTSFVVEVKSVFYFYLHGNVELGVKF